MRDEALLKDQKLEEERRRQAKAKRQAELEGKYVIRRTIDRFELPSDPKSTGQAAFAMLGTLAARSLPRILKSFRDIGASSYVGRILLGELAIGIKKMCFDNVPAEFVRRITDMECDNLPEGFDGKTLEEAREMEHLWTHDVSQAVERWLDSMEQGQDAPASLTIISSPGGSAAMLKLVVEAFKDRHPHKPVYLYTVMSEDKSLRLRFPRLREVYAPYVAGSIIHDNRRSSPLNDLGIRMLFGAMAASPALGGQPTQFTNAFARLFDTDSSVRYATTATWTESIPVSYLAPDADEGETYVTRGSVLEQKVLRGVKTLVEETDRQSVLLPTAPAGHARYAYVILPIIPDGRYSELIKRVEANLKSWIETHADGLKVHFASIGVDVTPETTTLPIIITLLVGLDDDGTKLDEYARKLITVPQLSADTTSTIDPGSLDTEVKRRVGRPRKEEGSGN